MDGLSPEEVRALVTRARAVKADPRACDDLLQGRTLLMVFSKPSVRTRLSFEVAMLELGGHAISYRTQESTLGIKETFRDFGAVASRYVSGIVARLHAQRDLEELAAGASVPVINGLTDHEHPCQALGDLLTMEEHRPLEGTKLAYVGDARNNVTHSLLLAAGQVGLRMSVACPETLAPDPAVLARARALAASSGGTIQLVVDPREAVQGAHFVYTDSWMSYHIPPTARSERVRLLEPYRVDADLMRAAPAARLMHCLPATRGEEVAADVLDSEASIVLDQAANRLHAQKALLLLLLRPASYDRIGPPPVR